MTVVARTVLGDVDPADLGIVLPHEHLVMDARPLLAVHAYRSGIDGVWDADVAAEARWNPGVHPENYVLLDEDLAVEELRPFVAAGGRTVVDLTPPTMGRDPDALARIARRAGIHVVSGTGQYLEPVHAGWVAGTTERELTEWLVTSVSAGTGGAGILGEIGTSNPVTPAERRVVRAAAAAARATGLAISIHLHPWGYEGGTVLDELVAAGADPTRVVLGHVTTAIDRPAYLRALLDRGANLGFDLFGFDHSLLGPGRWPPSDLDSARAVARLVHEGFAGSILLSQDIGVRTRLRRWGGWGYAHLLDHVVPLLRDEGVAEDDVRTMMVATPARILSVTA